jgi:exonuclease SbcD
VRLLHTSDWHLGRSFHRVDLIEAQREFLTWLIAEAVERDVDAVLVSGDVFDRAVPSVDAVALTSWVLAEFARAKITVVLIAGNHDSATRLGFASDLAEVTGIHIRTRTADLDRPVTLNDSAGPLHIFAIPYLDPDAVHDELRTGRSHTEVLTVAMNRIRSRLGDDPGRSVVLAHAFITGGQASDSERDIRVGGVGDAPASIFDGVNYVALGHLHGAQKVSGSSATVRYSGSPLAFSFSEINHVTSVTLVDIDGDGQVEFSLIPTPVPRPIARITGRLGDLLVDPALAVHEQSWLHVTLTDDRRPDTPMDQLRERFPHVLVMEFRPESPLVSIDADLARLRSAAHDPVEVGRAFLAYTGGGEPTDEEMAVIAQVEELARRVHETSA